MNTSNTKNYYMCETKSNKTERRNIQIYNYT